MSERPDWLDNWFEQIKDLSALRVAEIDLEASAQWSFTDGAIRHRSRRFFSVVGIDWTAPDGTRLSQPLLHQPETGILGFLLERSGAGNRLLAYAKVEPGNFNTVQLAPTCQATASNMERVHGGAPPPFAELFSRRGAEHAYDALQSEQGSRFLGKRNRNILAITGGPTELPTTHRWLPVEELLDLSDVSFALNSDARSVLICSPWEILVGRAPFSRYGQGFGAELARSAHALGAGERLGSVRAEIERRRGSTAKPVEVDLRDLGQWRLIPSGVEPTSGSPFRVLQINVETRSREVPSWDQPIIKSSGEGSVDLVCGRVDGTLHFLLRALAEPGLHNMVQLGPSLMLEPGERPHDDSLTTEGAVVRAECLHSEEGSRFLEDVNRFRLVDAGDTFEAPSGCFWLTLAEIRVLLDESGWLTNEARSALSLLLKWL